MPVTIWKTLRELHDKTQVETAQLVDITQSHYSNIERGVSRPSARTTTRLLEVLPIPKGFNQDAIIRHLSDEIPEEYASISRTLSEVRPVWDQELRTASGISRSPILSIDAQAGLVWLAWLSGGDQNSAVLDDERDDPTMIIKRWESLVSDIFSRGRGPGPVEALFAAHANNQTLDYDWNETWQLWSSLSEADKSLVANLIKTLAQKRIRSES